MNKYYRENKNHFCEVVSIKADKLYLGDIVTMNKIKPVAEALCVKDGIILYVGNEKTARTLCDENTEIIDLEEVGTSNLVCTIVDGEIVYKA